jgi:dTDP-4-amino-4,6-dideoxygalactose transaminase
VGSLSPAEDRDASNFSSKKKEPNLVYVPFNRPFVSGREIEFMQQAIASSQLSGDGQFTVRCSSLLERELGVPKVLLTTSCTHALEMSALLLDIKPGDEVIVPSFTFPSTINAFVLRGAQPVFIDIRPDTLNLDETKLKMLITSRTKAIVVVHYAGIGCEMEAILEVAAAHGIQVIEDNAHGLFGMYQRKYLGTFGTLSTLSFHETKNFICGEGGALVINDPKLIERAEIIREKGTDRSRFFRGQVDKYTWVDVGSSFLLSDILAAFLYAQLEEKETIQAKRKRVWDYYYDNLKDWAAGRGVNLPFVPENCEHPYHMFHLIMNSLEERTALISHLQARQVNAIFHFQPLHLSSMGRRLGGQQGDCPVAEATSNRLVRLPFYNDMTEAEQAQVVAGVKQFFN